MFGKGISREGDILDLAANIDVVKKSGAWYAYNGDKIGQGRENAKLYLAGHPDVMSEIEEKVRQHYQVSEVSEEEQEAVKEEMKDTREAEKKTKAAAKAAEKDVE